MGWGVHYGVVLLTERQTCCKGNGFWGLVVIRKRAAMPPMCHGSRGISLAVVFIFLVPFLPLALEAAFGLNGPHV